MHRDASKYDAFEDWVDRTVRKCGTARIFVIGCKVERIQEIPYFSGTT
jgi:hypothetical protein